MRISAKQLGEAALADACPRCLWLKIRLDHKLPYQIFPGIFATIDAWSKRLVRDWFDRRGGAPPWLAPLGPLKEYRPVSRLTMIADGVELTGVPDEVFTRPDGAYVIVDYKTAKRTGAQDGLYPMYELQLNGYAMMAEHRGFRPVTGLALVYFEPSSDPREDVAMGFAVDVVPVARDDAKVRAALAAAKRLAESPAPASRAGCKDCAAVERLGEVL